jgi:hypothetical protein
MDRYDVIDKLECLETLDGLETDDINALRIAEVILSKIDELECDNIMNDHIRICDECGEVMTQGYCINDGDEHYCSDECLHKHYTQDEYLEMYDDGNGDSYWTDWI